MTLLYQPVSRTFGQRDGCLTPKTQEEKKTTSIYSPIPKASYPLVAEACSGSAHEILSPPLSPSPRDAPIGENVKEYLDTNSLFKIEDFRSYSLTVDPWKNLDLDYKQRHLKFLNQYSLTPAKFNTLFAARLKERREERLATVAFNRRKHTSSGSDSESDSLERVRTRRIVKESLVSLSEIDSDASTTPSLPSLKKRKVKKELPYVGSPLAAQQAALIDESIPDYSPNAFETLPKGNSRCLKIEWKGQPMDLRNDPNLDKLHSAEALLASTLRLPCNVYLDSKRRLFHEKVSRLRGGMPFRRTDAQKACRIDVNKASRLFAAFEKVGWLEDRHFSHFL